MKTPWEYKQKYRDDTTLCNNCGKLSLPGKNLCDGCNETKRRISLRKLYGLTNEQIEALDSLRDDGCMICGELKYLCVDHNHETGEIRGLLCVHCNSCLGWY